jgi:hypothetical protein
MPIIPDTKNWTWVLDRECPECGFDASATDPHDVPELTRRNVAAWPAVLERDDVTKRPNEGTWSALEYAAHVRDVFRTMNTRFRLMLEEDDPQFADWDQDATAVLERYNEQDPAVVSAELQEAGLIVAATIAGVAEGDWQRTGLRGDGARFTVESLARYFIHDPVHHLYDVSTA